MDTCKYNKGYPLPCESTIIKWIIVEATYFLFLRSWLSSYWYCFRHGPVKLKFMEGPGCNCEQVWFPHPSTYDKMFVFADTLHFIKLLRNHFLKIGYKYNDTHII